MTSGLFRVNLQLMINKNIYYQYNVLLLHSEFFVTRIDLHEKKIELIHCHTYGDVWKHKGHALFH